MDETIIENIFPTVNNNFAVFSRPRHRPEQRVREGVSEMKQQEIREALEKQLQLLSEHSGKPHADLPALSHAMCEVISCLTLNFSQEV